jgi:hypothetical protein
VTGQDLDATQLDSIVHEAVVAGISERPSGPRALPRIC